MDANAGDHSNRLTLQPSADVLRTVEALIAGQRIEAIHTLAVALDAEADDLRARVNRAEFALNHVAFTLAETRGEEYVETLLKLLPNRPFFYKRLRGLAAAMARHQESDLLLRMVERYVSSNEYLQAVGEYYHIELLGLLLHEMIVRGVEVGENAAITLLKNKMRGRNHPLAWLPLALTDLEDELTRYLPDDDNRITFTLPPLGQSAALPPKPPPIVQPMLPLDLPPAAPTLPAIKETTRSYTAERIRIAVANWYNIETRTFALEPAITAHDVDARLLLALGLECLERADESMVNIRHTTPNRILARLFTIAATGGPHEGYEGAYGRLYTWQTLAALAGAAPDDSLDAACEQIKACLWFHFDAKTDWFYQAGWDVGVVALRPDGASLAALAATATD